MTIFEEIKEFVRIAFKTTVEVFLEALKLSPNAQGYVSGSITELLLKKHLEGLDFTVERIKEKWQGKKPGNHHGDFYFRQKDADNWYVLESKGVKSNSEKWHKLYNAEALMKFMFAHADKIPWIDANQDIEPQIDRWIDSNLPEFKNRYKSPLYDYKEVKRYIESRPERETRKSKAIDLLKDHTMEEIDHLIDERLDYLMSKFRVLETHFVAGMSESNDRIQATPRKDEFNLVSIDIFLRYNEHKFLFANPKHLESSGEDADHLQQNYIMGFVFIEDGQERLSLSDEWYDTFGEAFNTLTDKDSVNEDDMQIDSRSVVSPDQVV